MSLKGKGKIAWNHSWLGAVEWTSTSKLLELFSATLGQQLELASPAANSMADMLHQTSHSPPTPGPQYRTTTAVNSTVSYLSYTQREKERGEAIEIEIQWGISYSVTKTTVKREWREEWDNEGVSGWVSWWVGEWATVQGRNRIWLLFILALLNITYFWICRFLHHPV